MKFKFYIVLFFIGFLNHINAQDADLTVSVSKNQLGLNQRLRVNFSINKQGADNFKAPAFKNFKIVGGPSQSVSQSWINGKASFNKTYSYILKPKNKGTLIIEPASIEIYGDVIKSKPLEISVSEAVELPKNPNDPNYIAEQNIHLVAFISNTKPYEGEAIYVEYRIYVKDVEASLAGTPEKPKFEGFWNQEIDVKALEAKKGKYKGEEYSYAVLQKNVLIPTKTGKLYIEPLNADLYIRVPTKQVDFWGNRLTKNVELSFNSKRRLINVKSLPEEGKPVDFNGAVGDYKYTVALSKEALKANESSQIKVKVSGKGNLKLFELPDIETPSELEIYQPERKERTVVTSTGIKGSVTKTYTIVPQYKGKYKIPGTSFSYFNPKREKYVTINSEDLFVNILEGKEIKKEVSKDVAAVTKVNVGTTGDSFNFIKLKTKFTSIAKKDFYGSNMFYILLLVPLLILPTVYVIVKRKEKDTGNSKLSKVKLADKLARKYLSEARNKLGNKEEFYESLEKALHNYLKSKLGVETSEISKEKISELLQEKNIDNTIIKEFINVLKDCDFARYTPISDTEMQAEYEKAKSIIIELDKQL